MDNQEYTDKDLANDWQQLIDKKFNQSILKKETIMDAITKESKSSISELKKRLKYKIYWSVFFTVIFMVALLFNLNNSDLVILIGIIVATYVLGFIVLITKYRKLMDQGMDEEHLLQSLKNNIADIKSAINFENLWGAFVFAPIIFITLLGGKVLKGYTIIESLSDSKTLLIAIISIIVITPLMVWLSRKMNKIAFGRLIKDLEKNITKMETLS
jgi:cation transport ATPase